MAVGKALNCKGKEFHNNEVTGVTGATKIHKNLGVLEMSWEKRNAKLWTCYGKTLL